MPLFPIVVTTEIPRYYKAGVKKPNVWMYDTTATVSGGTAVFYLTTDGTADGDPVFTNIYTESVNLFVFDLLNQYQFGSLTVSVDKKTLTVSINRLGTIIAGLIQFITAANGTVIYLQVKGD